MLSETDLKRSVAGDWPESRFLLRIYHSIKTRSFYDVNRLDWI